MLFYHSLINECPGRTYCCFVRKDGSRFWADRDSYVGRYRHDMPRPFKELEIYTHHPECPCKGHDHVTAALPHERNRGRYARSVYTEGWSYPIAGPNLRLTGVDFWAPDFIDPAIEAGFVETRSEQLTQRGNHMTKREIALATIRSEVAHTGEVTKFAMRAYAETMMCI